MSTLRVFSIGSGEHISHAIILHTKFSKYLLTRYFLHRTDINVYLLFGCGCGGGDDGGLGDGYHYSFYDSDSKYSYTNILRTNTQCGMLVWRTRWEPEGAINAEISWLLWLLLDSQEGLCPLERVIILKDGEFLESYFSYSDQFVLYSVFSAEKNWRCRMIPANE
jgi:hypothetical protein